jgi:hypothetical protein
MRGRQSRPVDPGGEKISVSYWIAHIKDGLSYCAVAVGTFFRQFVSVYAYVRAVCRRRGIFDQVGLIDEGKPTLSKMGIREFQRRHSNQLASVSFVLNSYIVEK